MHPQPPVLLPLRLRWHRQQLRRYLAPHQDHLAAQLALRQRGTLKLTALRRSEHPQLQLYWQGASGGATVYRESLPWRRRCCQQYCQTSCQPHRDAWSHRHSQRCCAPVCLQPQIAQAERPDGQVSHCLDSEHCARTMVLSQAKKMTRLLRQQRRQC